MRSAWPLRLTRNQRLRRRNDFQRVFARRNRAGDQNLLIYARGNDLSHARLGLMVSRRLGRAVTRNRFKRRIREAFRTNQHDLPKDLDFVCIPRPGTPRTVESYARSLRRLLHLLRRRLAAAEQSS